MFSFRFSTHLEENNIAFSHNVLALVKINFVNNQQDTYSFLILFVNPSLYFREFESSLDS